MVGMINRGVLALLATVALGTAQAQTDFINEDFNAASGGTPPAGWTNVITSGDASFDFWRFGQSGVFDSVGNPGTLTFGGAITSTAALFDSDSTSSAGGLENVSMVSPSVNTTGYGVVRLKWDQDYHGGYQSGDAIFAEVWNGSAWNTVYTNALYATDGSAVTVGPVDIDVSAHAANRADVQVRFRFRGNWSWWWIVDNVQLYSTFDFPAVSGIVRAGASPTIAGSVTYTVTFSKSVTGVDASDFALSTTGVAGASIAGVTGSGTTYTVTVNTGSGDGTIRLDLVDDDTITSGVPLGGAGAGNGSFSAGQSYTVDRTAPTVTITQDGGQNDPSTGTGAAFRASFSEEVTGFTGADVSFAGSTVGGTPVANVLGTWPSYVVSVTGTDGVGTLVVSVAAGLAMDLAGNSNLASINVDNSVTFDNTRPTVSIDQAAGQADPSSASPILFSVVFSEAVTDFTGADLSFTGSTVAGTLVANVSGSGAAYTVAVTGMSGDGVVVASIPALLALDAAGLANFASTSVDNTVTFGAVPSVTINQAVGQVDPTNGSPVLFTVAFGGSVTGFTASDVSFAGSTVGGTLVANVTGSGPSYTVSVTGMTGSGTVVASIPAGAATNGVFNSLASTSTDNTVAFDGGAPTVTINQAGAQADPASAAPILFSVVFSEPVTGFTGADLSFAGSTAAGTLVAGVSGSGANYSVTVSGMTGNGNVVASLPAAAVTDLAGNASLASTSTDNSVTYTGAGAIVTSFAAPSATGTGTITASFTGGGATCSFSGPQFIGAPPGAAPIPPIAAPGSIAFLHGLFAFTTVNCTPGSTLAFTVTYPQALPAGTQYWKYGPEPGNATPHWYVLPAAIAGSVATFSITDGAQGDDDLAANGTIVDQGGPGFPVGPSAQPTPTVSEWALILMGLLMMGVAAGGLRRRP
jgi:hypothetical protein